MRIIRKEPHKISRKSSNEWTQNCEIDFILYDLPVECVKLGFNFKETIKKHINGLRKRKMPEDWDREGIIEYAEYALQNPPRVWNIGELMEGKSNFQWGIKYPKREAIEYTSY